MRYLIYLIAILLLIALNFGLFSYVQIFGAVPNLLLLFLIVAAVDKNNFDFVFIALVGGLLLDFYNGMLPGSFVLGFLMVGFVLQLGVNALVVDDLTWEKLVIIVIGSVVFVGLVLWLYGFIAGLLRVPGAHVDARILRSTFVGSLAYNIALFYPVYFFGTAVRNWILELEYNKRRS